MVKLEGIIFRTFNHYVVLRGFAPIKDLAAVSHKPDAYQRPAIEQHKEEIISFLSSGEYKYFPEITLACRVEKYDEFARNIGIDNAVVTNNINGNVQKKEKCKQIMQNYSQVGDTIHGSRNKKRSGTNGITKEQYEENKSTLHNLENEWHNLESRKQYLQLLLDNLSNYLKDSNDASKIKRVIMSLGKYYEQFNTQEYGNIAFLAAMVYYALLDTAQLDSFVHWAIRNGINKIVQSDDLSSDAPENLINMFDQIYSSKKNEIFVSMQFGDSQSELIFEKIVRATELFNKKHPHKNLDVYPIRIDRTVESSTYTIQDRILSAIKSCSLIIADLSSHNINVYHEIGYAMGIAEANNMYPNMILLYKEDTEHNKKKQDTDKFVGFNLRSLSQLRFKDYKQLVDGLVERLEKHYEV